jgi:sulfur carrier protein ThiS
MSASRPDASRVAVRVTFFAGVRRYLPPGAQGPQPWVLPAGATVADLLTAIGIPAAADVTVGVDGELAERESALRDGAEVMLLSPMEGGCG